MSQESVEHCNDAREQIRGFQLSEPQRAYPIVSQNLEEARKFYLGWLDIHTEYAKGFRDLGVTSSAQDATTQLVSKWVTDRVTSFQNIIYAQIRPEVYLLVSEFYRIFYRKQVFVLEQGNQFRSKDVATEMKEEFFKLSPPSRVESRVLALRTPLLDISICNIGYEATGHSSAKRWPMLLHEAAHSLYDTEKLYTINPQPTKSGTKELLLDLLVCYVFGPAYAVSLADYHRKYPGGSGLSHPKETARLYALLKSTETIIEYIGYIEKPYLSKIQSSYEALVNYWTPQKDRAVDEQEEVESIFEKLETAIKNYLSKCSIPTFDQFITKYEDSRESYDPKLETVIKMVEAGMPVAVDPRVLFNAIVDNENIQPILVSESLKRWVVLSAWRHIT